MILICTALRCEAQAIIESFKLTRSGDLFAGEQMLLYICGVRFGAKFEAGAEFVRRADTDAEFGRELRRDRRGADVKFEHRSDAAAARRPALREMWLKILKFQILAPRKIQSA